MENKINMKHPIIADAMEYTGLTEDGIYDKIEISQKELHKKWIEKDPQTYFEILNFYQNSEIGFYDILQYNTWSNAQKPFIDITKYDIKTVLEFGCGCGQTALILAGQGFEVDIADVNNLMTGFTFFRLKKNGYKCNIVQLDKYKPLTKNYDIITTVDVLEHIINPFEMIIHFREHSKYWYSTALKPIKMAQHLCLWENDKIIDIVKAIGWQPVQLSNDEGRGFFK